MPRVTSGACLADDADVAAHRPGIDDRRGRSRVAAVVDPDEVAQRVVQTVPGPADTHATPDQP
jgi:hypothetical protein